jgi:hypothetical protein
LYIQDFLERRVKKCVKQQKTELHKQKDEDTFRRRPIRRPRPVLRRSALFENLGKHKNEFEQLSGGPFAILTHFRNITFRLLSATKMEHVFFLCINFQEGSQLKRTKSYQIR